MAKRIASAVGVSSSSLNPAHKSLAARVQAAMVAAVERACADGLRTDEDAAEIRSRMMAARERVLNGG